MAEVGPPAELVDKLVLHVQRMPLGHASQNVGERDEAVGDVRRQLADGAIECVASACVGRWPHSRDASPRRGQRGCERRCEAGRQALIHAPHPPERSRSMVSSNRIVLIMHVSGCGKGDQRP